MKCISRQITAIILSFVFALSLCGCKKNDFDIPYDINTDITAYRFESDSTRVLRPFAENLCVADEDVNISSFDLSSAYSGFVFNRTTGQTIYSKNANMEVNPASTTKVMTALLALKYGKLDDILTASANVKFKDSNASKFGFVEGDKATLEQVLYALLVCSGNDAAVMIAEYVSGSEEAFVKLMNEEAHRLGATNTNFTNPHGLTDELHKTTAYDLYLIFNEALKYDKFKEIIKSKVYQISYFNKENSAKKKDAKTTNGYLGGLTKSPAGVSVIGGKTGYTQAAMYCLILYSINDSSGDEYVTCVMHSDNGDSLYQNMDALLLLEN